MAALDLAGEDTPGRHTYRGHCRPLLGVEPGGPGIHA
jgi:hypothetical protein